jgi:hypothetical protein
LHHELIKEMHNMVIDAIASDVFYYLLKDIVIILYPYFEEYKC